MAANKKKRTANSALDKGAAGGRWEGPPRSQKRPKLTLAQNNPDPGFSWAGLPADMLYFAAAISAALVGFVVTTSFVAEATGEGVILAVVSGLVALALPAGLASWAVRPLHRRRAYHWWLAVFCAPYLLATVVLSLAAPVRTARMLRWHGAWPARLIGPQAAKNMQVVVERAAGLLSSLPRGGGKVEVPTTQDDISAVDQPLPAYLGRVRPKKTANGLPEDFGRRSGRKVSLRRRNTVWTLTVLATQKKRPLSMLLDPHEPWTILTEEAVARLRIPIPEKGASVDLLGADRPVLIVDKFFLGGLSVNNVTVVVCSPCVPTGLSGLAGRNLLHRYNVSLDSKQGRLTVTAGKATQQTPEDIDAFLVVDQVSAKRSDDGLLVSGRIRNIAPLPMDAVEADIVFYDAADRVTQKDRVHLGRIAPGKTKHIKEALVPSQTSSGFRIQIVGGRWGPIGAKARRRRRRRHHAASPNKKRAHGAPNASR